MKLSLKALRISSYADNVSDAEVTEVKGGTAQLCNWTNDLFDYLKEQYLHPTWGIGQNVTPPYPVYGPTPVQLPKPIGGESLLTGIPSGL